MISVKNLCAGYSNNGGKNILKNITVDFSDGEITSIIGPNGSGKARCFNAARDFSAYPAGIFLQTVKA